MIITDIYLRHWDFWNHSLHVTYALHIEVNEQSEVDELKIHSDIFEKGTRKHLSHYN